MELSDAIKQRRSVRKYKDTPIPEHILAEMIESARLSPSGGNGQRYRFGIVTDNEIKIALGAAAGNQMWVAEAPVVIACCADISWDIAHQPEDDFGLIVNKERFGDELVKYLCDYPDRKMCMSLLDNATPLIAAEHVFLTATSHGLSACFIGYLNIEKANEILVLPPHITCLFLLPIGYADEQPSERSIKSIDEIVFYDKWGYKQNTIKKSE